MIQEYSDHAQLQFKQIADNKQNEIKAQGKFIKIETDVWSQG